MTREELRALIPRRYSFFLHIGLVHLLAGLAIVGGILLARGASWRELLLLPGGFLFANFFEYLVHRYPMHHRTQPLFLFFKRHTLQHHAYFHQDRMTVDDLRDMRYVLFPSWAFVAFILFVLPIYAALYFAWSPAACGVFVATSVGYYLLYEWLHMLYHLCESRGPARIAFFRKIREHHRVHHDPSLMTRHNFNITFPIIDWIVGSTYRDPRVASRSGEVLESRRA